MLKRFFLGLIVALTPLAAFAAGTIPLSMTQQLDQYGVPLSGCQLYTIQAGTTSTPQNAYKDTALTIPQPNPMPCDASGRLPQFFLADGQIKIRLLDKLGNPQVVLDNILVIGPSSGGGGGGTIDPTTIAATGDVKQVYGTQVLSGWVRANGRTIGNAVSGATERANADTSALFLYLWAADPNLTVTGGRTTAAADYAANKTIALPDAAGRGLAGLDDMGAGAKGRLTSAYFGTSGSCSGVSATLLGAACGGESHLLSVLEMPSHNHTGSSVSLGSALMNDNSPWGSGNSRLQNSGGTGHDSFRNLSDFSAGGTAPSVTIASQGGGLAHAVVQPTMLITIYLKL